MNYSLSKDVNINYTAKVVRLGESRKHQNADRLQIFSVDFNNVITDLSYKEGDIVIYFPVECQINKELISFTNGFSDKELNNDKTISGFFDKSGRVKAVRLRGERSEGIIFKCEDINAFFNSKINWVVNDIFDKVGDVLICNKYIIQSKQQNITKNNKYVTKTDRMIDGQFRFHVDTENLRRNAIKINPNDIISITYKLHGSSGIWSNILVKRKLKWYEKFLLMLGVNIKQEERDIIYSSRRVIKNQYIGDNKSNFYNDDIWGDALDILKDKIPPGISLYGEIVGYTKTGQEIQPKYDYGCQDGTFKIYIYRITFTTDSGLCLEFDPIQIMEFCERYKLNYKNIHYFYGYAKDKYPDIKIDTHWNENFILKLEEEYCNINCWMCKNKVPCEGVVVRKVSLFNYEAYKLKSGDFLLMETKMLDKGKIGLEL